MDRLEKIKGLNEQAMQMASMQWNRIAKPIHSLGVLENMVVQIAGITGSADVNLCRRAVVVMCADHGVVQEGISQSGSEVTGIVARAMAKGDGNINTLAACYDADVIPVDIGMAEPVAKEMRADTIAESLSGRILDRKIACGTGDIAKKAAMTKEQAVKALQTGMDIVAELKQEGYRVIVTGEMGIGNTTATAALASVLTGRTAKETTGRGAGLDHTRLMHKIKIVEQAVRVNLPVYYETEYGRHHDSIWHTTQEMVTLLAALGGYEIAGMAGLFLGGAVYGIPVVMDGVISTVAAALAAGMQEGVRDAILCSHISKEPAARELVRYMQLPHVIDAGLCLGEGTGGVMLLPLLDGALRLYHSSHLFEQLEIEQYEEYH